MTASAPSPLPTAMEARDGDGRKIETTRFLVSICQAESSYGVRFIGTGFFFATNLVATAKHNVMRDNSSPRDNLFMHQFLPGNISVRRLPLSVAWSGRADLAVIALAPMKHNETGLPLVNPRVALTERLPGVGEVVTTCAFPGTVVEEGEVPKVFLNVGFEAGHVEDVFPAGRDRVLKPEPCLQTSLIVRGGTSGGPVFDTKGRCFAVNSTSFDEARPSYVSPIGLMFSLALGPAINLQRPDGETITSPTVRQLIDAQHVHVEQ